MTDKILSEPVAYGKMELDEQDQGTTTTTTTPAPATWRERASNLFSRRFLLILLLGQVLALCITATTIFTTKLAQGEVPISIPTTQSFLNYLVLGVVYTSITLYKKGVSGWLEIMRRRSPYCKLSLHTFALFGCHCSFVCAEPFIYCFSLPPNGHRCNFIPTK